MRAQGMTGTPLSHQAPDFSARQLEEVGRVGVTINPRDLSASCPAQLSSTLGSKQA
jgi:hypothetical protein